MSLRVMLSSQRLCPSSCSLSVARIASSRPTAVAVIAEQWACRPPSPPYPRNHKEATMPTVDIFTDRSALIRAEAERFVSLLRDAIATRGRALVALSGGSTPKPLYQLLASRSYAEQID